MSDNERENALIEKIDFTFETVLSTDRNLNLLKREKMFISGGKMSFGMQMQLRN